MTARRKQQLLVGAGSLLSALYAAFAAFLLQAEAGSLVAGIIALTAILWAASLAAVLGLLVEPVPATIVISVLALSTALIGRLQPGAIGAAVLTALAAAAAYVRLQQNIANTLQYQFTRLYYRPLKLLLLAAAIIAAGLAFDEIAQDIATAGIRLPPAAINAVVKPLDQFLPDLVPGYSRDATVADVVQTQLQRGGLVPPHAERVSQEIKQQLADQLQQPVDGHDRLLTIAVTALNNRLAATTQASPVLAALIIITIGVGVLRVALPLVVWPALAICAGLLSSAERARVIYRVQEPATAERLRLMPPT